MRVITTDYISPNSEPAHVGWTELDARKQESVDLHGHDFFEVFWVLAGKGLHQVNGQSQALRKNDLICVRPTDIHAYQPASGQVLRFSNLAFPAPIIREVAERYFSGNLDFWGGDLELPQKFNLTREQRLTLDRLAAVIAGERASRLHTDFFLLTLVSFLPGQPLTHSLLTGPDWLRDACRKLREPGNFSQGARQLARLAGRSQEHVSRALKEHAGMTPGQLVNAYRLRHAACMLSTTNQPILGISLDCGFSSLSHFYRIFRQGFHLTPRAYRLGRGAALPGRGRKAGG